MTSVFALTALVAIAAGFGSLYQRDRLKYKNNVL
jgi:hypothetical protein